MTANGYCTAKIAERLDLVEIVFTSKYRSPAPVHDRMKPALLGALWIAQRCLKFIDNFRTHPSDQPIGPVAGMGKDQRLR